MTRAWTRRLTREQQFVRNLADEVRRAAGESGDYEQFLITFEIALLKQLLKDAGGDASFERTPAADLFRKTTIRITGFADGPSERRFLLALLFEFIHDSVSAWAVSEYRTNRGKDPQRVPRGASGRTAVSQE